MEARELGGSWIGSANGDQMLPKGSVVQRVLPEQDASLLPLNQLRADVGIRHRDLVDRRWWGRDDLLAADVGEEHVPVQPLCPPLFAARSRPPAEEVYVC